MSLSYTLEGLNNVDDVNKATNALMMLDGVQSAEVGLHFAHIEGRTSLEKVQKALTPLGFKARQG
ncbi:heavy-metal-associated domain-containing protein [Larsenimonas suaedae]|uniref:Heavy metal-associated domain-containing protein n=1 Tax=Larsenimonas suaedae TaxID=1851019 RepID=A0ABU1GYK7_9GAMM|nr:heavy metal-associated domain-containing protein [Larsenimonas suaedae]MCM2971386.1 heavy-metal-associated domain-containing protein [Larsenimonas suaedae]MDR5896642.1 heavy metal-associated domain-containing protein [Larsenimonas suaedae]